MARPPSKRPALLLTALSLSTIFAGLPAAVAHGPDTAGWIEQAGNGSGDSKPAISNLKVGTVLYSADVFAATPPSGPAVPRGLGRYMAWGTRPGGSGAQVFVTGSTNGIAWNNPVPARIQDPNGASVPLIIDQVGNPAVAFTARADSRNPPFAMLYRALGESATAAAALHFALSFDGIEWFQDLPLANVPGAPIVAPGGFKEKIIAPSQLIWNGTGLFTNSGCTAAAAYACRYTFLYTTEDAAGKRHVALAQHGDQIELPAATRPASGFGSSLLSPGGVGDFDENGAANATVQIVGGSYRSLYAGKNALGVSSIGWATSANGVTWTKSTTNPATPASLFAGATPAGGDLERAQFLADGSSEHARIYITRALGVGDLFLAATAPAPTTAPHVAVVSPEIGAVLGPKVPISIYVGDTLGATPGLNLQTLTVTIDGVGGLGLGSENTIVGQFQLVGKKISGLTSLADGPHTLVASVADLDNEITTVTVNFTVDGLAPNSTITLAPTGTEIGLVDSPGRFAATVIDPAGGTGIEYVTAQVTNPLGQIKRYTTHAPYGWLVTKVNAGRWDVVWTAPTLDPHFAVPGDYLVSILGADKAGNVEKADTANSAQVFVL